MANIFRKMKEKILALSGKIEQQQQAIAFAEAGEQEYAQELLQEQKVEEKRPGKLLVVGRNGAFSRDIMNYALEMAERMSYEMVALSAAPLNGGTFKLLTSSRKEELCRNFQDVAEQNVKPFQEEAAKRGLRLEHFVKFSETDEALEEIRKEAGQIQFVVSENVGEEVAARAENEKITRQEIYVYSML
jgi:hypothetical protein